MASNPRGISHAQAWEDPAVLRAALRIGPGDDVLAVASAGDNAFALAIDGARSVTCVDASAAQLALVEAKLVAARLLPVQSLRSFLGFGHFGRRVWFYHHIRPQLSRPAQTFWDANEAMIRQGIVTQGDFERGLSVFRERLLPLAHPPEVVRGMLACETIEQQERYFARRWNSFRWRQLARVSSRAAHLERVLTQAAVKDNYFAFWMLTGAFPDLEAAHPYLSTAGHAALKACADRLHLVHAPIEAFLEGVEPGSFSAFSYPPGPISGRLLDLTRRAARPGARVAAWSAGQGPTTDRISAGFRCLRVN